MKVLMVTQKVDLDDWLVGFTHTWVERLASKLDKLYVICLEKGRHNLQENVELYSMGKERGYGKIRRLWSFHNATIKIIGDVDIIFCHMNPIYTIIAAPYAKLWRKPIVTWYAHKTVSLLLRVAHSLATRVITSSEESFKLKSTKVSTLGHGIDINLFKPSNNVTRNQYGSKTILSVGRISPIKKYETLIEAANILINQKDLKGLQFVIVGDIGGPEQQKYLDELKQRVIRRQLNSFFHFRGSVPHRQVKDCYQSCDLFVNLSETDSLDKAVLEAMGCEKVVLTSNPSFRRILGKYSGRLMVKKGDPEALARKIIQLLSCKESNSIARRLRDIVVKGHSLEGLVEKLIGIFGEVSHTVD